MRTLLFMVKTIPGRAIRPPDRPPGTRRRPLPNPKPAPKNAERNIVKYKKKKYRKNPS